MTGLSERRQIIEWVDTAIRQGARQSQAAAIIGWPARTLQRWKQSGEIKENARTTREFVPSNTLTEEERGHVLSTANSLHRGQFSLCTIIFLWCIEQLAKPREQGCTWQQYEG